ncbi:EamA family transporter RarD [Leucobacter weissii]|uniref:EamA family transporter RarD n=1 Tax=Leucobacter weissii TaxID=1983706 RepID=A0A939SC85_9MICO|nr:EamA family transporter RarD [Leucobacter weissii]
MSTRLGYVYGIGAYLCWGAFPLFFMLLAEVDPLETVPWRVLTALVFCVLAVGAARRFGPVLAVIRSPRTLGWLAVSAVLLYVNWQIFVVGVVTGRIIETALGYFINPLVTILIGVVVRKEKLSRLQWVAVGIAGAGVLVSAIAYGQFPAIALGLAFSFGLYGAVRKQASERIDALTGLTVETMFGAVIAVAQLLVVLALLGHLGAFSHGPSVTIPLLLSGVVTAVPLLLFGAGNRRLPLSRMGFIQFLTPILGFLTGYFIFGEEMTAARWIGFVAVWAALIVLLIDAMRALRPRRRRDGPEPSPATGEIATRPIP